MHGMHEQPGREDAWHRTRSGNSGFPPPKVRGSLWSTQPEIVISFRNPGAIRTQSALPPLPPHTHPHLKCGSAFRIPAAASMCIDDETCTTRAPKPGVAAAPRLSAGSSARVSRKWPRWLLPMCASKASSVSSRATGGGGGQVGGRGGRREANVWGGQRGGCSPCVPQRHPRSPREDCGPSPHLCES